jgi:hypothetical protein
MAKQVIYAVAVFSNELDKIINWLNGEHKLVTQVHKLQHLCAPVSNSCARFVKYCYIPHDYYIKFEWGRSPVLLYWLSIPSHSIN